MKQKRCLEASVRASLQGQLGSFHKIILALKHQLKSAEAFICALDDLNTHNQVHYFSNEPTTFFGVVTSLAGDFYYRKSLFRYEHAGCYG